MSNLANPRIVVLISGFGSNLQALIDACTDNHLNARVVGVVSNVPTAFGLQRARDAGISTAVCVKRKDQDRHEYDSHLALVVKEFSPDWIVLAGWMRLLSFAFIHAFPGRIVNIHPALPGTFPGTHAIGRAFDAYQKGLITKTGVMVHLVPDEGIDSGPVIATESVTIFPEDTLETLEERIHQVEHHLLIRSLSTIVQSPHNQKSQNE